MRSIHFLENGSANRVAYQDGTVFVGAFVGIASSDESTSESEFSFYDNENK